MPKRYYNIADYGKGNSESASAIFLGITQIKHLTLCLLVHLIPYSAPRQLSFAFKAQGPTTFGDQIFFSPIVYILVQEK